MLLPELKVAIAFAFEQAKEESPRAVRLLSETLLQLGHQINDDYRNMPQLEEFRCSDCGCDFSITVSRNEDREPDTCVECWESGRYGADRSSVLRKPQYNYTRKAKE
jgi:hypothetical protein